MVRRGHIVVLDVGKTLAKLTLWSPERRLVERRTRANVTQRANGYPALDVDGIGAWLIETLTRFAAHGDIAAIIPAGHGAAACIVDDNGLCIAPPDYEAEPPADISAQYRRGRDPFRVTGSPCLPGGLNLGAQLHWLEAMAQARHGQILTWPQYWAWVLSGVAASEVTSLGSHTDLWMPGAGRPSPLAVSRGWADRLAPLRQASDILGPVREDWCRHCGLPRDCVVVCGIHDSNAALLAARRYPEIAGQPCTVLSTGTWFVAMRSLARGTEFDLGTLSEDRDCLVNVDATGVPVPSSRFMGGREAEILETGGADDTDSLLRLVPRIASARAFVLPTFYNGVGPFPQRQGVWIRRPRNPQERHAAVSLYLALMADTMLDLIGSRDPLVIEGRFASDAVFARTLAALRPGQTVHLSQMADNVSLGALQLVDAALPPQAMLARVTPLDTDLTDYADAWRASAANKELLHAGTA